MKVTILGCGSSYGVPVIACDCAVCVSADTKNKRTRVSLLVEKEGVNILIDTSPDFRNQALRENIRKIDAVLYTHDHADHTHGIDELRTFSHLAQKPIGIYSNAETITQLQQRFPYIFKHRPEINYLLPTLEANIAVDKTVGNFEVCGQKISYFTLQHGNSKTIGYRIDNIAYCVDCDKIPDEAFSMLSELDVLIVDCLSYKPSFSHAHLELTLSWIERAKPKRAVLTHMNHNIDYHELKTSLPAGIEPAFDGMRITI